MPCGERVERGQRAEVAAALAVRGVRVGELGVVVDVGVPGLGRRVGDRVDLAEDVAPVGVEVGGAREQARHPDDGDPPALGRAHPPAPAATPASRLSALLPVPDDVGQRGQQRGRRAPRNTWSQWHSGGLDSGPHPQLEPHGVARPAARSTRGTADLGRQQRHVPVQPRPHDLQLQRAVDASTGPATSARLGAPRASTVGACRPRSSIASTDDDALEQRPVEEQVAVGVGDRHREGGQRPRARPGRRGRRGAPAAARASGSARARLVGGEERRRRRRRAAGVAPARDRDRRRSSSVMPASTRMPLQRGDRAGPAAAARPPPSAPSRRRTGSTGRPSMRWSSRLGVAREVEARGRRPARRARRRAERRPRAARRRCAVPAGARADAGGPADDDLRLALAAVAQLLGQAPAGRRGPRSACTPRSANWRMTPSETMPVVRHGPQLIETTRACQRAVERAGRAC